MAFRNSIDSHKTVEAFFLYQMNQVCILDANENQIHGVVWDQGNYYSVKLLIHENDYRITKDGVTLISPYLSPYALAVDFAYQNQDLSTKHEIMKNKQIFSVILPFLLKMQATANLDDLSEYVDTLFEVIEEDVTKQGICKLMAYVELHHAFEMYAESRTEYRELYSALMEECVNSIDRILSAQTLRMDKFLSRVLLVNQDYSITRVLKDKKEVERH